MRTDSGERGQVPGRASRTPLAELLALERRYWVRHKRISSSINLLICECLAPPWMHNSEGPINIGLFDAHIMRILFPQAKRVPKEEPIHEQQSKHHNKYENQHGEHMFNHNTIENDNQNSNEGIQWMGLEWLTSILFNIMAFSGQIKAELMGNSKANSKLVASQQIQQYSQLIIGMTCVRTIIHVLYTRNVCEKETHIGDCREEDSWAEWGKTKYRHELAYAFLSIVGCMRVEDQQDPIYFQTSQMLELLARRTVQSSHDSTVIQQVNSIIFGTKPVQPYPGKSKIKELQRRLEDNRNVCLDAVARLISSNYHCYQTTRPIFQDCLLNGQEVICQIVGSLVTEHRHNKSYIFSQTMADESILMQVLLHFMEIQFMGAYVDWVRAISHFLPGHASTNERTVYRNVSGFLHRLGVEQREFVEFLGRIYDILTSRCKFSQMTSMQILKKLLLNRFLLNLQLYSHYYTRECNTQENEHLHVIFNQLRLSFYPHKQHSYSHSIFPSISQKHSLQSILSNLVSGGSEDALNLQHGSNMEKSRNQNNSENENNNRGFQNRMYVQDRELRRQYKLLYDEWGMEGCQKERRGETNTLGLDSNTKQANASYQLSFSFVRKDGMHSRRQQLHSNWPTKGQNNQERLNECLGLSDTEEHENINNNRNTNMNISQSESIKQRIWPSADECLNSPTSQKSRRTVHTQHSDSKTDEHMSMSILDSLITRRRALGMARRTIDGRRAHCRRQTTQLNHYLARLHRDFRSRRQNLESLANKVRLYLQLV